MKTFYMHVVCILLELAPARIRKQWEIRNEKERPHGPGPIPVNILNINMSRMGRKALGGPPIRPLFARFPSFSSPFIALPSNTDRFGAAETLEIGRAAEEGVKREAPRGNAGRASGSVG